jgi:PAS domain S-box-containing protein
MLNQERLLRQINIYDAIFQQSPIGIAISFNSEAQTAEEAETFRINPMYEKITGRSKEELRRVGWASITHPDDIAENLRYYTRFLAEEIDNYAMEKRFIRPDGSIVWVHMTVTRLILGERFQYNHVSLIQDITDRKIMESALVESERGKAVLLAHLPGLAYRCLNDDNWTMKYVSEGCFNLTGYAAERLLDNKDLSFNELIAPEYRELLRREWERVFAHNLSFSYEYEIITASGKRKWVLELGEGIRNSQGEYDTLEGIIIDITDRKQMENRLKYDAEHDRWTGLLNRSSLEKLLSQHRLLPPQGKRALFSINLSSIQILTTTYGFHYTQELMKQIADTLRFLSSKNRLLFSTHETRFVFYLFNGSEEAEAEIQILRDAIIALLEPMLVAERLNGGLGILEIDPANEQDVNQLLKKLLIASEKALTIHDKGVACCVFDAAMEAEINREEKIKQELSCIAADIDCSSFYLEYQPIIDLKTRKISGFEALARIRTEALGRISPVEFIPVAEKAKLMTELGQNILLKAFTFLKKLEDLGEKEIQVAVNLSATQLLKPDFYVSLTTLVKKMQVSPQQIGLEITESIYISSHQEVNRILKSLMDYGFQIAIDDFGTGYSSLAREQDLNINSLKIDKAFVWKLRELAPEKVILGDIISMAHKMGHCVVAEGVEDELQLNYLIEHGCDQVQGFYFAKSLSEEDALKMLRNWKK